MSLASLWSFLWQVSNTLPLGQRWIVEEVHLLIRRRRGRLKGLHLVFTPLLFNGGDAVGL